MPKEFKSAYGAGYLIRSFENPVGQVRSPRQCLELGVPLRHPVQHLGLAAAGLQALMTGLFPQR